MKKAILHFTAVEAGLKYVTGMSAPLQLEKPLCQAKHRIPVQNAGPHCRAGFGVDCGRRIRTYVSLLTLLVQDVTDRSVQLLLPLIFPAILVGFITEQNSVVTW